MESYIKMFILLLLWVLIGLLIGALANGVRLQPASWGRRGWLYLPAAGALLAVLGGWLGTLLLAVLFATATAILFTIVGVTMCTMVQVFVETVRDQEHTEIDGCDNQYQND